MISIVIPLYNKGERVKLAIDSALHQDYDGEWEIVVVDDGSTDDSAEYVKAYKDDKRRIDDFLLKFDYKGEFRKVVEQVLLHEVYYCWWRKTKWGNKGQMKYALQMLPQEYCMLTAMSDVCPLFDS